jgi:hypothetical protein
MEFFKNALKDFLLHITRGPELGASSGVVGQFVNQFTGSTAETTVRLNDEWDKRSMFTASAFEVLPVFPNLSLSCGAEACSNGMGKIGGTSWVNDGDIYVD